jgi:hypothetical protein
VKQRCGSNQFIEINDKMEMSNRVFISNNLCGRKEQDSGETERERVCERQSVAGKER